MSGLSRLRAGFERLLEFLIVVLMAAMALLVVVAVVYRTAGASLVWYDEVAAIMLTWLTYYGAALAALKRAHIGVSDLVDAVGPRARLVLLLAAEAAVIGFFLLLAWLGWQVLEVLEGSRLISLPEVPLQWAQSVIPVGAILFVVAELLSLPGMVARIAAGHSLGHAGGAGEEDAP